METDGGETCGSDGQSSPTSRKLQGTFRIVLLAVIVFGLVYTVLTHAAQHNADGGHKTVQVQGTTRRGAGGGMVEKRETFNAQFSTPRIQGPAMNGVWLGAIGAEATGSYSSATKLNGDTFVDATVKLGDCSENLTALAVHSAVEAALRKLELIDYLPDSEGKPTIKVFQGRRVIIDDSIPVRAGTTSGYVYTSYLFGPGCFARGNASLSEPVEGGHGTKAVEWERSALDSDTNLINRRRYLLHPRGVKFTSSSLAGQSPTNAELETVANWTRVFEAKNIRMVAIDHNI